MQIYLFFSVDLWVKCDLMFCSWDSSFCLRHWNCVLILVALGQAASWGFDASHHSSKTNANQSTDAALVLMPSCLCISIQYTWKSSISQRSRFSKVCWLPHASQTQRRSFVCFCSTGVLHSTYCIVLVNLCNQNLEFYNWVMQLLCCDWTGVITWYSDQQHDCKCDLYWGAQLPHFSWYIKHKSQLN